jgi:hypothetical protein
VLADVTGSAVLIWRFHSERSRAAPSGRIEARAAVVVAIALALVAEAWRTTSEGRGHPGRRLASCQGAPGDAEIGTSTCRRDD